MPLTAICDLYGEAFCSVRHRCAGNTCPNDAAQCQWEERGCRALEKVKEDAIKGERRGGIRVGVWLKLGDIVECLYDGVNNVSIVIA